MNDMEQQWYCTECVARRQGKALQLFTTVVMVCEVCERDVVPWEAKYNEAPVVTFPLPPGATWQERLQDLQQRGHYMMVERFGTEAMRVCLDLTNPYLHVEVLGREAFGASDRYAAIASIPTYRNLAIGKSYAELMVRTQGHGMHVQITEVAAVALDGQAVDPNVVESVNISYEIPDYPQRQGQGY